MKNDKPCVKCKHCRSVYAQDQWSFLGCYHEPYHGKWVATIKDCPMDPAEAEQLMKDNVAEAQMDWLIKEDLL